ncbi:hypothetical protein [Kitasatospora albolonga]|uniref:hypothetical protein n=1 Tax=Kitasatospora albolonga TaxID=68173 RepID=UPI0031EEEBF0
MPGGWIAAALLLVSTAAALVAADRAAATVPLARLRERARTAAGVLAALRTVELRSARLAVNSANGSLRQRRLRLPAPRRAWQVVPWRDTPRAAALPGAAGPRGGARGAGAALRRPRPRHPGRSVLAGHRRGAGLRLPGGGAAAGARPDRDRRRAARLLVAVPPSPG